MAANIHQVPRSSIYGVARMSRTQLELATRLDGAADTADNLFDELVPEKSFCREHQVTNRTARGWRERGQGPEYMRIGRSIFYRRSRIQRWHNSRSFQHRAEEAAV